jgi:sortase A
LFERALWIGGALGLGWCAFVIGASRVDQFLANRELDRAVAHRPIPAAPTTPIAQKLPPEAISTSDLEWPERDGPPATTRDLRRASAPRPRPVPLPIRGAIIARIEIESLGLSVVAREGDDTRTLRLAVGHIPGTAVPGREGNAVFAGHRDRQFHGLGKLKLNDTIRVTTPAGDYVYRVEWTAVVDPNALWVMDPTPDSTLTLVTCFPFGYVGNAPDRFVVRARRVES